jgi:outer membrane protein assembly factor BamB
VPDLNGDGKDDCYVGCRDNMLYCFSGGLRSGSQSLWGANIKSDIWDIATIPNIDNLDSDGKRECIVATSGNAVECRASSTGNLLWSFALAADAWCVAVVNDIDEDGFDDVIAGSAENKVFAIAGNRGAKIWTANFSGDIWAVAGIGDLTQDNKPEVAVGTAENRIVCLGGGGSQAGKELWSYATSGDVKTLAISPDVNGNKMPEVIAGSTDANLRLLEGNTLILDVELTAFQAQRQAQGVLLSWHTASEKLNLGFEVQCSIDGLAYQAIGFIPGQGTTSLSHSYEFLHSVNQSGTLYYRLKQMDYDGSIEYSPALTVNLQAPASFALAGNYPNPFNGGTFIKYQLPETGQVRITLFDMRGEKIWSREQGMQKAGAYSVYWDGRSSSGSSVPSGNYLYGAVAEPVSIRQNNFAEIDKDIEERASGQQENHGGVRHPSGSDQDGPGHQRIDTASRRASDSGIHVPASRNAAAGAGSF